eukprot:5219341-Heterocapsa_arctica.AAC.1
MAPRRAASQPSQAGRRASHPCRAASQGPAAQCPGSARSPGKPNGYRQVALTIGQTSYVHYRTSRPRQ